MSIKTITELEGKINKLKESLINSVHEVERVTIRESKATHEAALVLLRAAEGKDVSKEDLHFLKGQSINVAKVLAIIGLQAVPFSSAAIVAIEVVARKHGYSIFPTDQHYNEDKNLANDRI